MLKKDNLAVVEDNDCCFGREIELATNCFGMLCSVQISLIEVSKIMTSRKIKNFLAICISLQLAKL
jgi:hypothetical protein